MSINDKLMQWQRASPGRTVHISWDSLLSCWLVFLYDENSPIKAIGIACREKPEKANNSMYWVGNMSLDVAIELALLNWDLENKMVRP
jgi:hypothetical protein